MHDLLIWWFTWGSAVFLVATVLVAALVLFDAHARRTPAFGWKLGAIVAPLLILPSVLFKTQLDKGVGGDGAVIEGTAAIFLWIGVIAALASIIDAIGYFTLVAQRSAPERPALVAAAAVPVGGSVTHRDGMLPRGPARGGFGRPQPRRAQANAVLVLKNGPSGLREHRLLTGRTTIGRESVRDVMLDDPDVSRDHASIQEQGGRFSVWDHASTHGTFLNGRRVRGQMFLEDGDELVFGSTAQMLFKQF